MATPDTTPGLVLLTLGGASDAGHAASDAAAWLAAHSPGWVALEAAPDGDSDGAAARVAVGLRETLADAAASGAAAAVLLVAQAGAVPHTRELPVRVDEVPGAPLPAHHVLVTVPAYATAPPHPAAQLALVEAALAVVGGTAAARLWGHARGLADDADAWRRGADRLAQADPDVARLVRGWEAAPSAPDAERLTRAVELHLRSVVADAEPRRR